VCGAVRELMAEIAPHAEPGAKRFAAAAGATD
jgi:hypothetical protein